MRLLVFLIFSVVLLDMHSIAMAAPNQSASGEACTKSGTVRRDGKDAATGEKLNCQWDFCTFCGTTGGKIDCSILKTEYSNATDCKAAARVIPNKGGLIRDRPKLRATQ